MAKETRAKVVCASCGAQLGYKDVVIPEGMPAVTHGLCDDCKAEAIRAWSCRRGCRAETRGRKE